MPTISDADAPHLPRFLASAVLRGGGGGGGAALSVERATPGEEVQGSIPSVAARFPMVGSVSV